MPRVAVNADAYAANRIGIFFPANDQTPADGNLTGQCVTLNKWFLAEMTDVPNPFAARGDARYVGKRLVTEGHAVEVPYDQRREGDFAVFEYGQYGHIGVLLSDPNRIFEENVNVGGVARKLVDGAYVYASRIGNLNESWRTVKPNIYRIKSYGGNTMPNNGDVDNILGELWGRKPNPEDYGYTQQSWHDFIYNALSAYPYQNRKADYADAVEKRKGFDNVLGIAETRSANFQRICDALGIVRQPDEQATTDQLVAKIQGLLTAVASIGALQAQISELSERPTQKELDDLKKAADDANAKALALQNEKAEDEKTGNAFMRWIGDQLNKLIGKG
jgi:FtsZ-binding cell division protein ZapB